MNPVKQVLQHLVVSFGSLFLLTSLFAQELPLSQLQSLTPGTHRRPAQFKR